MTDKLKVLLIEKGNKIKCKRNHPPSFNHRIKGTRQRFCTYLVDTNSVDAKYQKLECGDQK